MTGSFVGGGCGIAGNVVFSSGVVIDPRIASCVLFIADSHLTVQPKTTQMFA